jgi:DNA-binding GntR family transcriptional regulator
LRRSSTAEQVAAALREEILAGRLVAGGHLREAPLAENFGVSRNTVREAIQILARQGLVTHEMHRGARVTRIDANEIHDVYLVRRLVELSALERAPDSGRLEPLEQALKALKVAVDAGNDGEITEADLAFHRVIAGLSDSPRLAALYEEVEGETRLSVTIIGNAHPDAHRLVEELHEVLVLLREGDAAGASKVLEAHLSEAEGVLVGLLGAGEAASR